MKTLTHRLGYGLAFLVIIVSCSQPESEEPIIDTSRDVVEVSGEYMADLMTAYRTFVENLSEEERTKLEDYINPNTSRINSSNSRTQTEARCRCLATQAFCEAKGWLGECCACWDPDTQVGMCGVFGGVGSCIVEERPSREKNPEKPSPKPGTGIVTIKLFPNHIKNLVDYIDRSRLGASSPTSASGLHDFKALLSQL